MARLEALAGSGEAWGIPVFCLGEFLRLVTHRRPFDPPHGPAEACEALTRLLAAANVSVLMPGPGYPERLGEAVREVGTAGNLVFDEQIAALCRDLGISVLLTEDRDFERFGGLDIERLPAG
ncbi:MAG: PIN domain-containing protein [Rhodobacter sp.]|nr:PIN domain-containing protein [Rhodobacter sp.]